MATTATVLIADHPFADGALYFDWAKKNSIEILDPRCKSEDEVVPHAGKADIIIASFLPITKKTISKAKKCKLLQAQGIGFNHIDIEAAKEFGIPVANNPGWSAEEVAEHAIGLMFAAGLQISRASARMHAGAWPRDDVATIHRIKGQTMGLVAFGRIARNVAERALGLGMRVIAYDPYVNVDDMKDCGVEKVEKMEDLLAESDYVSCHTPLNEATHHLFNEDLFRAMKPTAYFINTARGGVMDEAALARAVTEGWILGAGVDVFEVEPLAKENPLVGIDNIVLTPHQAGGSVEAYTYGQELIIAELERVLAGEAPSNRVG